MLIATPQETLSENVAVDSMESPFPMTAVFKAHPYNWLDNIHIISGLSRRPADIAVELNIELGSIINPIMCRIGENNHVIVLMSSDMACDPLQVSRALNQAHLPVSRLTGAEITTLTGATLDEQFPLQLAFDMPVVIDASLKRFASLYSQAGSRKCVIETSFSDLKDLTAGIVSYAVAGVSWFKSK